MTSRVPLRVPTSEASEVLLPPNYTQITLKKEVILKDLRLYYEHRTWDEERHRSIYYYSLYSFRLGTGHSLSYIYTEEFRRIASPWQLLAQLTRNDVFHEGTENPKILPPKRKRVIEIAKEHCVETFEIEEGEIGRRERRYKTPPEIWRDIIMEHLGGEPFLFKLLKPLTEEEVRHIRSWDFEQVKRDYLYEGWHKNEKVVYALEANVVNFHSNPDAERKITQRVMPYQGHSDIIGPSKEGKTTLAKKITKLGGGTYSDDASKAGLSGFADAEKENEGALDGTYGSNVLDNVHEYSDESIRKMLEIRETGEQVSLKGMGPVVARTTAAITCILNPPDIRSSDTRTLTDAIQVAQFFEVYIRKQSLISAGPVGTRTSLPLILLESDPVVKLKDDEGRDIEPLDNVTVDKNELIFLHIMRIVNNKVETEIFPNNQVQAWLNRNIDGFYETIKRFIDASTVRPPIANYWTSLARGAFRHIRGGALKHGILDNLKAIYLGQYDIARIIQNAEEHLHRILGLIIESMQNMLGVLSQVPREEWILNKYQSLTKKAQQAVVLGAAIYAKNHSEMPNTLSMQFEEVREDYNRLSSELKPLPNYGTIEQYLPKTPAGLNRFNRFIRDFGIFLAKQGQQSILTITFASSLEDLRNLVDKLMETMTQAEV